MTQENTRTRAMSSGFGNNCLLHCMVHSLFSLSETQLKQIAARPAFDSLMKTFKDHYKLSKEPNLDMVIYLNRTLKSPTDIEIVWGPVFRELLLQTVEGNEELFKEINNDQPIPDETGALVAKMFGVSLTVHHAFSSVQGPITYFADDKICHVNVYHSVLDGGASHYNFDYPNDENGVKARQHNNNRNSVESKILRGSHQDISNADVRKKIVKDFLENDMNWMEKTSRKGVRMEVPIRDPKPAFELKIKRKPISTNTEDAGASAVNTHSDAVTTPPNVTTTPDAADATIIYSKEFHERLLTLFSREHWQHHLDGNKLSIAHLTNKSRVVDIVRCPKSDDITFTCGANGTDDMLLSAIAYQETMAPDCRYELMVGSKEQAATMLLKMKETGFNINKLDSVTIGNKALVGNDLQKLMQEVFQKPVVDESDKVENRSRKRI